MSARLNALALPALPYVLAVAATCGGIAAYNHGQREIGQRDLLLASARADLRAETQRADSLAQVYRVDTVRFTALRTRWDTLYAQITDTMTLARSDTVRVPVQVLVTADSTIRACTAVVQTCEQRVAAATALIWKTLLVVEQHFRKLNAPHLCTAVYDGVVFHDGVRAVIPTRKLRAA